MMWNDKLVSVIILCYKNINVLPRALTSIFMQDYPQIELIISDDGSPEFSPVKIENFIINNKNANIKNVHILSSKCNTGTVSNLRRALTQSHGDYYINFGADDAFANDTSISDYISTFCMRAWEPLLVCGQAAMFSEDLTKRQRYLLDDGDKEVLYSEDPVQLLNTLAYKCIIPTVATCYRKDFPQIVSAYDPQYKYYEDYPTFIRMARKGIVPVFINKVMIKHAAGGIANGNQNYDVEASLNLYKDRKRMWKKEIDPYLRVLTNQSRTLNAERRKREQGELLSPLASNFLQLSFFGKLTFFAELLKTFFSKSSFTSIIQELHILIAKSWKRLYGISSMLMIICVLLYFTDYLSTYFLLATILVSGIFAILLALLTTVIVFQKYFCELSTAFMFLAIISSHLKFIPSVYINFTTHFFLNISLMFFIFMIGSKIRNFSKFITSLLSSYKTSSQ